MTQRKYVLSYAREGYWEWDGLGLLACQSWNYGNANNWFYSFRAGLNGFHARMAGAEHHYTAMHAWLPRPRPPKETEYHLAFECLVFALNALGYAIKREGFRDTGDDGGLRRIGPTDLLGDARKGTRPLPAYVNFYPKTVALCGASRSLLEVIFEQHNASKHRHMIYVGGDMRTDAPEGFWETLNVADENRNEFLPVHDVILDNDILLPLHKRKPESDEEFPYFEDLAECFFHLIGAMGETIVDDTQSNAIYPRLNNSTC
jgi:hypothetical protein